MKRLFSILLVPSAVLLAAIVLSMPATAQDSKLNPTTNPSLVELQKNFLSPHRDFSTGPLWTWNERLTDEQVRSTLRDLARQHVKQVWVHPRPGLMTPYLSDEWFARWKTALDEAKKRDMNVWIYDENSYPSGFAGGFVPEALPDSRARSLRFDDAEQLDKIGGDVLYIFDPVGKLIFDKNNSKGVDKLPAIDGGGKYIVVKNQFGGSGGWFGGKWYVDVLKKGVTEKFLDITLDAYKNVPEIGKEFGNRVPGIFTDEPHPAGSLVWNDEIPVAFEKRFGYSLVENLPSLVKQIGDWKKVRHNYYQIVLDKFIENWSQPYFERCEKYGLEWTGHYWEHGWPGTSNGPDNMAMYAWHQRPAIDLLMNNYNGNSPNAQFGNVRSVKELASVANQMGHSRTLSENYGAGGWDLRFEDLKRLGDWSYVLGVNTNNEHLSYVTIRGARKRDHPQSFSYHARWFEGYHVLADYFTRLSYVLSQGKQVNHVVIIEPTTTAWMYQRDHKLGEIGQSFTNFVNALERSQVEYDLASEDIIKRHGKIEGKKFVINKAKYDLVIIPPNTENLNGTTYELLSKYKQNGGNFFHVDKKPEFKDGAAFDSTSIFQNENEITLAEAIAIAKQRTDEDGLVITTDPPEIANVFHHRRRLANGEAVFICNSNINREVKVSVRTDKKKITFWNPYSGHPTDTIDESNFDITLLPSQSTLFILSGSNNKNNAVKNVTVANDTVAVQTNSKLEIKRLEDNVLTLDYVDVKVGGEERKDIYAWQANRFIFQKHGFGSNPWDNQVQFKDTLITKKFPAGSGFEAVYNFTLQESIPQNLSIVIERPDLYTIYCNDKEIKPAQGEWWLDRAFGKIDLSKTAKVGKNSVKIIADLMTMEHELEPAYLLGDFSLRSADKGFVVVPPTRLTLSPESDATGTFVNDRWHGESIERIAWLSNGVGFNTAASKDDREPKLEFDLGKEYEVAAIRIWNYNEQNMKQRGAKTVEISGLGNVELPRGNGLPFDVKFNKSAKIITFKIIANHNNTTYPIPENVKPNDSGFVGLSEVQFLVKAGDDFVPIKNVTVKASSELVTNQHDRKAKFIVDGSGFGVGLSKYGWNRQGMPFYAGKVEYKKNFVITSNDESSDDTSKRYFVKLNDWYGATAEIRVNDKSEGYIVSAPFQLDVTSKILSGENEVSVIVYGTPKNLLGPHHNGSGRGSAWPSNFQRAPENQPSGDAYDSIDYGLFAPFELQQY
ncbi:MAG: hypothetical protein LBQ66_16340 [Planctomycetaceae bacterium]|jgi:hypothetical protein|nr:hypothetical protein [Planctomycetaceae bacterium]